MVIAIVLVCCCVQAMVSNITRDDHLSQPYVITTHPVATTEASSRNEIAKHFEVEMRSIDVYTANSSDGESLESEESDDPDLEAGKQPTEYGI